MISIPSDNFKPVTLNTRGHQSHFQCSQTTCDSYRYSFFPSAIRLCNCLPTNIATFADFNEFNFKLYQHFINNCILHVHYTLFRGLHINKNVSKK